MSKQLTQMVKKIQFEKELTIDEVAKSIDYSRVHLQREMKKEGPSPVIDILRNKYKDVIQNVSSENHGVNTNELIQAINRLTESTEKIVQSNNEAVASNKGVTEKVAETNSKLADTNAELVQLLKARSGPVNLNVPDFSIQMTSIIAHLKTIVQLDALARSGGDIQKAEKILAETGKMIVSNAGLHSVKDTRKSKSHN